MALSEKQEKAIELIVSGENITDTAKLVNVNRRTIYDWLDKEEFKTELHRQTTQAREQVKQKINTSLESIVSGMLKIALTSKSEANRLEASKYLMDHALGRATTKTMEIINKEDDKDKVEDIDDLIENIDYIVDIKKAN